MKKVISIFWVILAMLLFGGVRDIEIITMLSVWGLIMVLGGQWIGDTIGSRTGYMFRLTWITAPSPGEAFVFLGWLLIAVSYIVGIIEIFVK